MEIDAKLIIKNLLEQISGLSNANAILKAQVQTLQDQGGTAENKE